DGAFGITSIVFIAAAANATVTLDGNNPDGFLPINGIEFSVGVPEPTTVVLTILGLVGLGFVRRGRR
ncbi:MAG: PEP-CTERM sorting domain-containing protein, partial [Pirellulales bacterium]|nr:PEP-CTERM sorting domain-containing protein [Pirellulales bacterium]